MATVETIHSIYREIFGRDAGPEALAARAGQTPEQIRADLLASEEYRLAQEGRIHGIYEELLGRQADPGALAARFPQSLSQVQADILASPEYRMRQQRLQEQTRREQEEAAKRAQAERDNRDAHSRIRTTLERFGLESLADWAWDQVTRGSSEARILLDLQQQEAFKQRFKAIEQRRQAGLPALSPAQVIEFENNARSLMRAAGLPKGFYDHPDDFTKFLVNDVSLTELQNRVALAEQAVFNEDPVLRAERARFGVTPGEEVAFALDPNRAFPLIRERFAAAGLSAQGVRSGFGQLRRDEANQLVDLGVTEDEAVQGFDFLTRNRELFTPLAGTREGEIDRQTQLSAVFEGSTQARETLQRRAEKRRAPFIGGGQFLAGQEGITGLGRSR